jgi:hypothetical protein
LSTTLQSRSVGPLIAEQTTRVKLERMTCSVGRKNKICAPFGRMLGVLKDIVRSMLLRPGFVASLVTLTDLISLGISCGRFDRLYYPMLVMKFSAMISNTVILSVLFLAYITFTT